MLLPLFCGFSSVFILLAVLANKAGSIITPYMKYVKIFFGVLVIIMGLNYMDILKFNFFSKLKKFNVDVRKLNIAKAFVFGILFSISMTPCVGTFLSSALLLIASKDNLIEGLILIILYCLGMGIPFIISALLIDKLKNAFDFIKKHYKIVKVISGIILIIMALYLIIF